jgi:DNA-binding response OmpR family regulator
MNVLIADDDFVCRRLLQATLLELGYEVIVTLNGEDAWDELQKPEAPSLAILDLMMPKLDGIEVCRRVRQTANMAQTYIILLTSRSDKEDIVRGLDAGANDYITKPFSVAELHARIKVGLQVVDLQLKLAQRVQELESVLDKVKLLQGMLPICSHCKRIRDDKNYWQQVEHYITKHSEAIFSHSICPSCYDIYIKPELEMLRIDSELE